MATVARPSLSPDLELDLKSLESLKMMTASAKRRATATLALFVICIGMGMGASGCRSTRCDGSTAAVVEVRDRDGVIAFSLRPRGTGLAVCDGAERRLGDLAGGPDRLVLSDPAGGEVLSIAPGPDPGDSLLRRPDGTVWRLHDEDGLVRVLDREGVPLAQVGYDGYDRDRDGAAPRRAVAWDPAGNPLASAERADAEGDRRVLRARDGAVTRILIGLHDDRAAAALALDRLPPVERLALARWLDRPATRR